MRTYLSVDLDFFSDGNWGYKHTFVTKENINFLNQIASKSRNLYFAVNHQAAYFHIRKSPKFNQLVNLDFHSDLVDNIPPVEFNCGSWANFIPNRKNIDFLWVYPKHQRYKLERGYCHGEHSPSPFSGNSDFRSAKKERFVSENHFLNKINQTELVGVSFVLSPEYGGDFYQEWFETTAEKMGIRIDNRSEDALQRIGPNPKR